MLDLHEEGLYQVLEVEVERLLPLVVLQSEGRLRAIILDHYGLAVVYSEHLPELSPQLLSCSEPLSDLEALHCFRRGLDLKRSLQEHLILLLFQCALQSQLVDDKSSPFRDVRANRFVNQLADACVPALRPPLLPYASRVGSVRLLLLLLDLGGTAPLEVVGCDRAYGDVLAVHLNGAHVGLFQ